MDKHTVFVLKANSKFISNAGSKHKLSSMIGTNLCELPSRELFQQTRGKLFTSLDTVTLSVHQLPVNGTAEHDNFHYYLMTTRNQFVSKFMILFVTFILSILALKTPDSAFRNQSPIHQVSDLQGSSDGIQR